VQAAPFVESSRGERSDDAALVNGGCDPTTGLFSRLAKARGLGDCGHENFWGWDGARFVLVERREFDRCRGVISNWWPRTAHARVVR
jgi:hypothetical protein